MYSEVATPNQLRTSVRSYCWSLLYNSPVPLTKKSHGSEFEQRKYKRHNRCTNRGTGQPLDHTVPTTAGGFVASGRFACGVGMEFGR